MTNKIVPLLAIASIALSGCLGGNPTDTVESEPEYTSEVRESVSRGAWLVTLSSENGSEGTIRLESDRNQANGTGLESTDETCELLVGQNNWRMGRTDVFGPNNGVDSSVGSAWVEPTFYDIRGAGLASASFSITPSQNVEFLISMAYPANIEAESTIVVYSSETVNVKVERVGESTCITEPPPELAGLGAYTRYGGGTANFELDLKALNVFIWPENADGEYSLVADGETIVSGNDPTDLVFTVEDSSQVNLTGHYVNIHRDGVPPRHEPPFFHFSTDIPLGWNSELSFILDYGL